MAHSTCTCEVIEIIESMAARILKYTSYGSIFFGKDKFEIWNDLFEMIVFILPSCKPDIMNWCQLTAVCYA